MVVSSAIWRWLTVDKPEDYPPDTLPELDQRWQLHQVEMARRWSGHLVVPHDAGHSVHKDAPQLVAAVVDATVAAARYGQPITLDPAAIRAAGGSLRVSATPDVLRAWLPSGELDRPLPEPP